MRKKRIRRGTILALLAAAAFVPLHADTYQFIISGNPVAAATVDSCAVASTATSLDTGTLSTPAASQGLEARFRTWLASEGTGLLSTLLKKGLMLIFR